VPTPEGPRGVRALPAHPNLEHLKNEAKQRLRAMRADEPTAKLATAQLQVARDYGFASWRRLKSHVDESAGGRFGVLIHNDDQTPMEFVVWTLQDVFSIPRERAPGIMLGAHRRGKALCGVYERAEAERLADLVAERAKVHGHPFRCAVVPMSEVGPDVAGRVSHALAGSASAADAARMLREEGWKIDPDGPAVWVKTPGMAGGFGLGVGEVGGGRVAIVIPEFFGYTPPGGVEALPTLDDVFGEERPPPPPTPEMAAIGERVMAGATPVETAAALQAIGALEPPEGIAPREPGDRPVVFDLESARFFRSKGDQPRVLLVLTHDEGKGYRVMRIPGTESYPAIDSLPLFDPKSPLGAAP
jgi:ATP-dependent Clp protease adapter protein ClpS